MNKAEFCEAVAGMVTGLQPLAAQRGSARHFGEAGPPFLELLAEAGGDDGRQPDRIVSKDAAVAAFQAILEGYGEEAQAG